MNLSRQLARLVSGAMIVIVSGGAALAEESALPVSGGKAPVIKQLLDAMRTTQNAQLGMDTMVQQQVKGMSVSMANRIDANPSMTIEQKMESKRSANVMLNKIMKRYGEILAERVNVPELVTSTYGKLYEKYFSLEELKSMLAYYQSPTGQKQLNVMPGLLQEALQQINPIVLSHIKDVSAQIEKEAHDGKFEQ